MSKIIPAVSKSALCSFLVQYHWLNNIDKLAGEPGIIKLFQRIGSIQFDPLNMVGRNPHLVLQSRIKGFTADMLDKVMYQDRVLIDAWDKEMSIHLTADWPYFKRIRKCREKSVKYILERRGQENTLSYTKQILKIIQKQGPLGASEIDLGKCQASSWGHRNISGAALDYLCAKGDLGVFAKRNTQKLYDLTGRLLPEEIINAPDPFKNDNDFYEWYFLRRIKSIGVHWLKNGGAWNGYFLSDSRLRKRIFESLEKKELIQPIQVNGIDETFYICTQDMNLLNAKPDYDNSIKILAPLDNMLWDRALIQKVFNFTYSWEVYLPAEKRKYGYYVLPVLYQNRIIARMEPEMHRANNPFAIKKWWWEPEISINNKIKSAVRNGLKQFAEYLQADSIDKNTFHIIFE